MSVVYTHIMTMGRQKHKAQPQRYCYLTSKEYEKEQDNELVQTCGSISDYSARYTLQGSGQLYC